MRVNELMQISRIVIIGFLTCSGLTGCSRSTTDEWSARQPQVFPVSGTVILDGQPLAGASVTFSPSTEQSSAAAAMTNDAGEFELTTFKPRDGAAAGSYRVSITKFETVTPPPGYHPDTSPPLPAPKLLTPKKYSDFNTSRLVADVADQGPNHFEFTLTSK